MKGKTGKISDKTHEEHLKLYTGYINKTNAILKELETLGGTLDPANPAHANQIYSEIRSRKVDFTFALGGVINHELYFNNLGGKGGPATGKVADLITKASAASTLIKKDLKATGIAARGWVWTGYDRADRPALQLHRRRAEHVSRVGREAGARTGRLRARLLRGLLHGPRRLHRRVHELRRLGRSERATRLIYLV